MEKLRSNWIGWAAALYLALLVVGLFRREHGLMVAWQVSKQCQRMRDKVVALEEENSALGREKERLRVDQRYLEKVAREELHMIGERELVFVFPEKN